MKYSPSALLAVVIFSACAVFTTPAEAASPPLTLPPGAQVVSEANYGRIRIWQIGFSGEIADLSVVQTRFPSKWTSFRAFARNLKKQFEQSYGGEWVVTVRRNYYTVTNRNSSVTLFEKGELRRNGRVFVKATATGPTGDRYTAALIKAVRGM